MIQAGVLFTKPPMVVAFRGHLLEGIMKKHRITEIDLYGSLRSAGIFNICEVEVVVVGEFTPRSTNGSWTQC